MCDTCVHSVHSQESHGKHHVRGEEELLRWRPSAQTHLRSQLCLTRDIALLVLQETVFMCT